MIYLAQGTPFTEGQFNFIGARSNSLYLNTTISASVGVIQSKLWEKGTRGRDNDIIIMHFFFEERGKILHTLGA